MNNESQQQQIPEAKLNPEKPCRHCHCYLSYDTACPSSSGFPSHTHTQAHTQIDNVAASQSQQGSQVKIGKAARYANVEWGMENAILLTLCCTFNMATPC